MSRLASLVFALFLLIAGNTSAWANLRAEIDLSAQRMRVIENGQVSHVWRVSTGDDGHWTPTGRFRPTRLEWGWVSTIYNVPMPYSVFFHHGYAIHGTKETKKLGRPASRGCVRLHPSHARTFFNKVKAYGRKNTRIVVRW